MFQLTPPFRLCQVNRMLCSIVSENGLTPVRRTAQPRPIDESCKRARTNNGVPGPHHLIDARRRRLVPAFIPDRLDQGAVVELDG